MTTKSSFLPRLSLRGESSSTLPLHNQSSTIRKKPSEYDLSDLSPRPDDDLLSPRPFPERNQSSSERLSSSPSLAFSDKASTASSATKNKHQVLFAGPPPPIATSRVLYRDEEDQIQHNSAPRKLEVASIARNLNSVLFDRVSPARSRDVIQEYEPDTIWRNMQRRERTLQKELQLLLDAQSAGLAANLDPTAAPSSTRSDVSDAGSSTPTTTSAVRRSQVTFEEPIRATASGEIIPVRQPRRKPIGLRAARAGLARTIELLADLKSEEDANLTAALSTRKKALAHLKKLSARRSGITEELKALESDTEEPLTRELRELGEEHEGVTAEISELEERLIGLRNRRRWLGGRIQDVKNRREAGLSGYKGALKEVESQVSSILTRPVVKPIDADAIIGPRNQASGSGNMEDLQPSPGGPEFLRMRPERRTVEMARDWWKSEVAILERRKLEVDKERMALEEGVGVWKDAVKLVADFEADLRREMKAGSDGGASEQAIFAQLGKMATVTAALEQHLAVAEEKGWNLLICAIGAELAAFKEAQQMLREVLHASGLDVDLLHNDGSDGNNDDERTPQLGRSMSMMRPSSVTGSARNSVLLGNLRGSTVFKADSQNPGRIAGNNSGNLPHGHGEGENDNEVPADLMVTQQLEEPSSPTLSREDSENEVPPEFLAQHHADGDELEQI